MDANVELQAACAALGYLDGNNYHKEPDCLGNHSHGFLAQDVIYTSRAYAMMPVSVCLPSVCPSVCDGSALAHYS